MKFQTTNKPLPAFSFSSLTDIVMLLLIFFMITSQFVLQTGVKVHLPGAKNNDQSEPTIMVVTITPEGVIYVGKDPVALPDLTAKLNELKAQSDKSNLIIQADKVVPIERVIQVIDAARSAQIEKFKIKKKKKVE